MRIRAELAVYPFHEGEVPPAYVQAASRALEDAGLSPEVGPLGQVVTGEAEPLLDALRAAQDAAFAAGATRIALNLEREP
jgi:uncharacterized protein YqgV (UPF0045/DUF77 family)